MPKRPSLAVALCLLSVNALAAARTGPPAVAERVELHPSRSGRVRLSAWKMSCEERDGRLVLNADQQGAPWAGVIFKPTVDGGALLTTTPGWVATGCVRFRVNGLHDAYGQPSSPCSFQVRLVGCMGRYQRVPLRFYEGERGIDADPQTWQEVLVTLKFLGVKPGARVEAVGIQCVGRPSSAFGIGEVSLVRLSRPLARDAERTAMDVAQPQVTWPTYDGLPDALKPERNAPLLRGDTFVTADGRRTFLIMPWDREDQKLSRGINAEGKVCPDFGLYDKRTQAFIYERPLDARSMARVGYNCFAGQVDPRPFWEAIGYKGQPWGSFTHQAFVEHVRGMGYPFYVDMVCFPWTLGKPAHDKGAKLDPGILHNGNRHWTPYRIIGKGRETWLTMWRVYARRYKEAGARVLFYELMNEPAYAATTPDHRAEFVEWLKRRHRTIDRVNATWGTTYGSWQAIQDFKSVRDCTGIFFDYDDYLAERFADLVRAGRDAIEAIDPGVPAAIQTMGGYTLQPRDAIHLAKLIPIERAVLAPTGGGRWTRGVPTAKPREHTIEYAVGPSPIANDLLLAMAGRKMIVDNELYLGPGQTRAAMRDRLWKAVFAGLDGAAWFSWSKRGWAWWRGRENILREADKFPYSNLIPFARRADAIRGVLDFANEMELVREFVLPKPWGPPAKVGMVYSWANARWASWEPSRRGRQGNVHAAMHCLHWSFDVVPSHLAAPDRLARYEMLVAGGIDHVEPELLARLTAFVRNGGRLVVADSTMGADLYGKPLDPAPLLGVKVKGKTRVRAGGFEVVGLPELACLPGPVSRAAARLDVELVAPAEPLWRDAQGRPVVTRHRLDKGEVYFIAADLRGYPLAKLLALIRRRAASPPTLTLADAGTGELAPNVLVSRRSYASHHALLLLNADDFPKLLTVRLGGEDGAWHASDPLEGHAFRGPGGKLAWQAAELAGTGVTTCIAGGGRGLVLLTREPWSKTELAPVDPAATKARFESEMAAWKAAR